MSSRESVIHCYDRGGGELRGICHTLLRQGEAQGNMSYTVTTGGLRGICHTLLRQGRAQGNMSYTVTTGGSSGEYVIS